MTETPQFLKRMIVSAINAREVESARVSRLLHDEVGQILTAVGLQMDVLKLDYRGEIPEITPRIHEIQKMLDQAVEQVRTLSYDLNPSIVERAGLYSALDRLVGRFRSRYKGSLRFLWDPALRVPVQVGNIWYRIAELGLDNAVTHSGAERIELQVRSSARQFVLEVRDDGCGFESDAVASQATGFGLLLMEHYATQVPLALEVRSKPGQGTVVRAAWARAKSNTESAES
ncbi:MAG: hypothetical protein H7039_01740 [Bryobacteraceae bacterium]|nr:hypothetical protein [Bryobacteraceae bacterium]